MKDPERIFVKRQQKVVKSQQKGVKSQRKVVKSLHKVVKSQQKAGLGNRSFWKRANRSFFAKKSKKKSERAIRSFCALSLFLKRA